jgi:hypothetical protein
MDLVVVKRCQQGRENSFSTPRVLIASSSSSSVAQAANEQ